MEPYPILEFDPNPSAILNPPGARPEQGLPTRAVLCFFYEVLAELAASGKLIQAGYLLSEIGQNPIYVLEHQGQSIAVIHPGVGAPLAAAFLDEAIALGMKRFIACGGCGVLVPEIAAGHPVVLTSAVRDEGTSYHYLPPSREVAPGPAATDALIRVMEAEGLAYLRGKAWTTDAIYRETPARRAARLAEGCIVVEMEAAAFFAVARFRGVEFGQVVYGGDLVVPEGWDHRDWFLRKNDRQRMFWLAVEACANL